MWPLSGMMAYGCSRPRAVIQQQRTDPTALALIFRSRLAEAYANGLAGDWIMMSAHLQGDKDVVTRRDILITLGTGALALTLSAPNLGAQQARRTSKIGLLTVNPVESLLREFRQSLRDLGYIEGETILIESRSAEGEIDRLQELARELVRLKLDVIVATNDVVIASLRRETRTIPIVMALSSDPAGTGFVASLAHPGGNATGLSSLSPEISGKRLELAKEVVPGLSRVAILWNPDSRGNLIDYRETESKARVLNLELQSVEVSRIEDLDRALSIVLKGRAQALIVPPGNPVAVGRREVITTFAARSRLPVIYGGSDSVDSGGLISYGPSTRDMFRRAAVYVDKILKGAKPGDLPIEQPTKFELVVNLRTAKALGIKIPHSILVRANRVIE